MNGLKTESQTIVLEKRAINSAMRDKQIILCLVARILEMSVASARHHMILAGCPSSLGLD